MHPALFSSPWFALATGLLALVALQVGLSPWAVGAATILVGATVASKYIDDAITIDTAFPNPKDPDVGYVITYHNPLHFKRVSVVFDPTVVNFDYYVLSIIYHKWTDPRVPKGKQMTKGTPITTEPGMQEIVLANNYRRPRVTDSKYIHKIIVFFLARPRPAGDPFLVGLDKVRTDLQVRKYIKGDQFQLVRQTGDGWKQPQSFAS